MISLSLLAWIEDSSQQEALLTSLRGEIYFSKRKYCFGTQAKTTFSWCSYKKLMEILFSTAFPSIENDLRLHSKYYFRVEIFLEFMSLSVV